MNNNTICSITRVNSKVYKKMAFHTAVINAVYINTPATVFNKNGLSGDGDLISKIKLNISILNIIFYYKSSFQSRRQPVHYLNQSQLVNIRACITKVTLPFYNQILELI